MPPKEALAVGVSGKSWVGVSAAGGACTVANRAKPALLATRKSMFWGTWRTHRGRQRDVGFLGSRRQVRHPRCGRRLSRRVAAGQHLLWRSRLPLHRTASEGGLFRQRRSRPSQDSQNHRNMRMLPSRMIIAALSTKPRTGRDVQILAAVKNHFPISANWQLGPVTQWPDLAS